MIKRAVREVVFSSIIGRFRGDGMPSQIEEANGVGVFSEGIPYPPEGAHDTALCLLDQKTFDLACHTALPRPSFEEKLFFYEETNNRQYDKKNEYHLFGEGPFSGPGNMTLRGQGVQSLPLFISSWPRNPRG